MGINNTAVDYGIEGNEERLESMKFISSLAGFPGREKNVVLPRGRIRARKLLGKTTRSTIERRASTWSRVYYAGK